MKIYLISPAHCLDGGFAMIQVKYPDRSCYRTQYSGNADDRPKLVFLRIESQGTT